MIGKYPCSAAIDCRSEEVVKLIGGLEISLQTDQLLASVHSARVTIKGLRAWLRLASVCSGANNWKEIDRQLRDVARSLSMRRDQQACIESLKWLFKKTNKKLLRKATKRLIGQLKSSTGPRQKIEPIVSEQLIENLFALHASMGSRVNILHGLCRTRARLCKIGRRAFSQKATVSDLHRFRKWAKYFYYQLQLYPEYQQTHFLLYQKELKKTGNMLGRLHDLVLIRAYVASQKEFLSLRQTNLLLELIEDHISRLQKSSRRFYMCLCD